MKRTTGLIIIVVFLLDSILAGCNSKAAKTEAPVAEQKPAAAQIDQAKNSYEGLQFDDKKDPVCNMPLSAGINDTAHYDKKLYGFCSAACKEEFEKNPIAYVRMIK